ncbi:DegT/DnrJ/EryC1/StrS family aminotransferase [Flavobacterium lacus]|uniref:dTDP-4-amino-4,6-dideoxygalactose transaminase n=1 Tax=Flavobacterium lacus TaxID=1353778 RepID=A0A328WWJ6_9FLAO|nr:DegT/DnrJ/EryC1/StrS family aminotransferase [Flavobacterium lacus]RAR47219.1 dTDP-4-amino-4,6-dideoxygalactose transaminase [Flavobacterium lacus]
MKLEKIWLSSPHMGGNEHYFVNEAFATNWIAPLGPHVDGFEHDLENYLGQEKHIAALSSGTAALHLGLLLLGVSKDDEVICQSMTFSASANPILYLGATPIFVDSEQETWTICPTALEEAIIDRIKLGKKPKAIIAVHLYGMPYQVDRLQSISEKYSIPILEDSAEALGSSYKGQKCGTFGSLSVLSFNGNKIITTSGGGALVANSRETKEKAVFLATQARNNTPHYEHSEIGYNYRLSNVCAGIGRGQMEVLDAHITLRRNMHAFYVHFFESFDFVTVLSEPTEDYFSNHWLTAISINETLSQGKNREGLRLALEVAGIESRPLWKPMHLQPVFAKYPYYGTTVCEDLFANGLCLPSGSNLTDNCRTRISAALNNYFN